MKRQIILTAVLSVLIPLTVLSACDNELRKEDISCKQALELMEKHKADTNFVIIDFRPKKKFDQEHLKNAVCFDVYDDGIDEWLKGLDKDKIYLLYCELGARSASGLRKMKELGFKNLFHMYEEIQQWKKDGYKIYTAPQKEKK